MDEIDPGTFATRVAIECVTLWLESDRQSAAEHVVRLQYESDAPGSNTIILGLLTLSHLLVLMLAKERSTESDDLVEKARGILQELSRGLPE